jgi:geranylgeranyl transferase type-2 subunit beta
MTSEPYLLRLATRLSAGLARLDSGRRDRHRAFVAAQQTPDGGFADREGGSDLYYTGFALRSLALLGGLAPRECTQLGEYLQQNARRKLTVIDLVSWLYAALVVQASGGGDQLAAWAADWPDRLAAMLESFRTADGGYAKTDEGAAGSTYHSFLVALCYELIGKTVPEPQRLVQFVYDRQRDDGGFVEIQQMKRSGTNPTAAAVALLQMHGALDDEVRDDVRAFLLDVRSGEGGFQANTRIPFADGLSTFTGLLTAQDLGLGDLLPPAQVEQFINSLELPGGGFKGASWDQQADVEYTFYGLGVLGLLWSARTP